MQEGIKDTGLQSVLDIHALCVRTHRARPQGPRAPKHKTLGHPGLQQPLLVDTSFLYAKAKEGAHSRADAVASEGGREPYPAVNARGGDAAEVGADIATVCDACAVTEQQ